MGGRYIMPVLVMPVLMKGALTLKPIDAGVRRAHPADDPALVPADLR